MYTFAGTTEEGSLRVLVGMTAAELSRVQENEGILAVHPQPGLWWAVIVEERSEKSRDGAARARNFMRGRYGVTMPEVVTMPAKDVADLLRCEQRVFHCSPGRGSDLIVFVEKSEESLKASLPLFGIESAVVESEQRRFARFSMN